MYNCITTRTFIKATEF